MKTYMLPQQGEGKQTESATVFTSCLWQTASTVVECADRIFVFDPAYFPHEIEAIASYVNTIRRDRSVVLVLTHGDWDHIAGVAAFADATVVAQQQILAEGRLSEQLAAVCDFDERYYVERKQPYQLPQIDRVITEEQTVEEWRIRFIPVPGHQDDMMATLFVGQKLLVMGDMLSNLEFPFINDGVRYLESLAKIEQLLTNGEIELLIPGHGSPAGVAEIRERIDHDRLYIEAGKKLVREGRKQGASKEACKEAFLQLTYRDKPISPGILKMHTGNFEVFWEEEEAVLSNG